MKNRKASLHSRTPQTRSLLLFIILLLAMALTACAASPIPQNETAVPIDQKYTLATTYFDAYLDANPDRTAFTEGESDAATYLLNAFKTIGLTNATKAPFTIEDNTSSYTSYNVTGVYETNQFTSANVIIGFNYDNNYGRSAYSSATRAEGAALASGAAAVLAIADYLVTNAVELPYNVTFAAFGAGNSDGLGVYERISYGAYVYVNGDGLGAQPMSVHDIGNTKLMINIDNIAVGDKLYIYTGETETASQRLFRASAGNLATLDENRLHEVPSNRPYTNTATEYVSGLSVLHRGTIGAHAPFMSKLNTAHFFGANLDFGINNIYAESKNYPNITHTKHDTREVLAQINTDYRTRITTTAAIVLETLTSADFINAHETRIESGFLDNVLYLTLIKLGALLICGGIAVFIAIWLIKKHHPPIIILYDPPRKKSVFGAEYENNSEIDETNSQNPMPPTDNDVFKGY